jgi:hypothetical protein
VEAEGLGFRSDVIDHGFIPAQPHIARVNLGREERDMLADLERPTGLRQRRFRWQCQDCFDELVGRPVAVRFDVVADGAGGVVTTPKSQKPSAGSNDQNLSVAERIWFALDGDRVGTVLTGISFTQFAVVIAAEDVVSLRN